MRMFWAVFVILSLLPGVARSVSLQDLFSGQNLQVGDKSFRNWQLVETVTSDSLFLPDFQYIDVAGIIDPMNSGLRFTTNGELSVVGENFLNVAFGFDVLVMDPGFSISKSTLEMTHFTTITPDSAYFLIGIGNKLTEPGGSVSANQLVQAVRAYSDLLHSTQFEPQHFLHIETFVLTQGIGDPNWVGVDAFEQRFEQVAVPEPATLILLGAGLMGLAITSRRFKSNYRTAPSAYN